MLLALLTAAGGQAWSSRPSARSHDFGAGNKSGAVGRCSGTVCSRGSSDFDKLSRVDKELEGGMEDEEDEDVSAVEEGNLILPSYCLLSAESLDSKLLWVNKKIGEITALVIRHRENFILTT